MSKAGSDCRERRVALRHEIPIRLSGSLWIAEELNALIQSLWRDVDGRHSHDIMLVQLTIWMEETSSVAPSGASPGCGNVVDNG
jgi:hypothetical protein